MKYLTFIFFILFTANISSAKEMTFENYMDRTRGNDSSYEDKFQSLIFSDSDFIDNCWNKLAPLSFELFYTIDTSGVASDIVWFPSEIEAECLTRKLSTTNLPIPKQTFYGWWLIWDGSGG